MSSNQSFTGTPKHSRQPKSSPEVKYLLEVTLRLKLIFVQTSVMLVNGHMTCK